MSLASLWPLQEKETLHKVFASQSKKSPSLLTNLPFFFSLGHATADFFWWKSSPKVWTNAPSSDAIRFIPRRAGTFRALQVSLLHTRHSRGCHGTASFSSYPFTEHCAAETALMKTEDNCGIHFVFACEISAIHNFCLGIPWVLSICVWGKLVKRKNISLETEIPDERTHKTRPSFTCMFQTGTCQSLWATNKKVPRAQMSLKCNPRHFIEEADHGEMFQTCCPYSNNNNTTRQGTTVTYLTRECKYIFQVLTLQSFVVIKNRNHCLFAGREVVNLFICWQMSCNLFLISEDLVVLFPLGVREQSLRLGAIGQEE